MGLEPTPVATAGVAPTICWCVRSGPLPEGAARRGTDSRYDAQVQEVCWTGYRLTRVPQVSSGGCQAGPAMASRALAAGASKMWVGDVAGGASARTDARSPRGRSTALGTPSPLESARSICAASGTPSVSGRFVRAALATPSPLASGSTLSGTPSPAGVGANRYAVAIGVPHRLMASGLIRAQQPRLSAVLGPSWRGVQRCVSGPDDGLRHGVCGDASVWRQVWRGVQPAPLRRG